MARIFYAKPDQQIEFLKKVLEINANSKGVDIGCGAGYHTFKLQETTKNIYGIDRNIPEYELNNFIQKDIFKDNLDFNNNLDFAYALAPYFGENWNNLETLFANLKNYLKPNGLFLLDLFDFNSKKIGLEFQAYAVYPKKIELTTYYRQEKAYTGKRIIKFNDWSEKYQDLHWRVFHKEELVQIGLSQGFELVAEYGSFNLKSDKLNQPAWEETVDQENRVVLLFKATD